MPVVKRFVHKPLEVQVLMYDGANHQEVMEFSGGKIAYFPGQRRLVLEKGRETETIPHGHMVLKESDGTIRVATIDAVVSQYDEVDD